VVVLRLRERLLNTKRRLAGTAKRASVHFRTLTYKLGFLEKRMKKVVLSLGVALAQLMAVTLSPLAKSTPPTARLLRLKGNPAEKKAARAERKAVGADAAAAKAAEGGDAATGGDKAALRKGHPGRAQAARAKRKAAGAEAAKTEKNGQ
jgi:hypothetical protein